MKIVFFIGTFNFGGAEKHALLLSDYYKNHLNWDTEVWGWSELDGPIPEKCKKINVKTKNVPRWNYKGWASRKLFELKYKALFKGVDVVMSFNNKSNIFCAEFLPHTNVKLHVWAQQGIDGYLFTKESHRKSLKNLKCVISNSQNGIDFLEKLNVPVNVMHKVPNGIDTSINLENIQTSKWEESLNLNSEIQFNAIMVGNITRLKDHITLIKAWEIVKRKLQQKSIKANLFLAGRKDNMYEESFSLVNNLQLTENVHFLGVIGDVYGLVKKMDVAILSSPNEGLPNAILETMLLGKPFIGTNIIGIREAVGEQNFQYLSAPKDYEALADNILQFALSKELTKEIGKKNRAFVLETYPIEKLWKDTHKIITDLLK